MYPVSSVYTHMAELAAAGRSFAVATVVRTLGSTPQVVGAKLVVTDIPEGRPFGTLGGGCVEADAILAAQEVLLHGRRSVRAYELTEELAWNTGLVCGGTMWILVEPGVEAVMSGGRPALDDAVSAASGGKPIAFVTSLHRDGPRTTFESRVMVQADGRLSGTLGEEAADRRAVEAGLDQMRHGTPRLVAISASRDLLVEPVTTRPRLVIAGGGHVARAIARQAALVDFDVTILEDRPEFADPARFGGATVVAGEVPESITALDYGWQTYLVIATRGHKLDADCMLAAIRTNARYIGLLGSRRKTILIEEMLREAGVPDDRLAVVHAPVGLDLGGRTPAEIALSVMAEITQERYAGSGRPLRAPGPRETLAER